MLNKDKTVKGMAHKIGRNDPCPCGSGKKHKKCCMEAEIASIRALDVADFKWRQLRQLEGAVIDNHLIPYATQELPQEILKEALSEFYPQDLPEALDKEMLFHYFFLPWFLFNWILFEDFDSDKTIAQNYLENYADRLNSQERLFIEAMNQSYYSFYSVLHVEREKFLLVKDILLGTTHEIKERQGTYQLKRGDIVFSRILTLEAQSIFIGMAPFVVPAHYQTTLIDFRKWLIEENDNVSLTPKALREKLDWPLLDYFFEIMQVLFNEPFPTLMNTDGEAIQFSKSYFKLTMAPEEALNRLLPLTLSEDPEEFLHEAKKDKSGKIKKIEFSWLGKGNKKHKSWDNTILGRIVLEQDRLILETNSQERAHLGKKLLSQYLDDALSFQKTLIETPEQKMKSLPKSNPREDQDAQKLSEMPEIQEYLKAMAAAHWESWFDDSIPALDHKTPREAAKTEEGREKLEALLLEYERNDLERGDHPFKADITYLKRELNLNS